MWDCRPEANTDRLKKTGGVFHSEIGIPFQIPLKGLNSCFVSIWDNFPTRISLPVNREGRKIYFLIASCTHPMQSQIENGRITVEFEDGRSDRLKHRELSLVNPHNLDDWLCDPYTQSGFIQ